MDSDHFGEDITLNLYPKYKYKAVLKGPKREGKEAFLKAINDHPGHLYGENPQKIRGYCFFCVKKSNIKTHNKRKSVNSPFFLVLELERKEGSESL